MTFDTFLTNLRDKLEERKKKIENFKDFHDSPDT